ncbi:MAG: hypothetical protein NTY37_03615 [Methanothrix sp.]|nr:hypothetical protein [Methanothrix sp.]
MLAGALNSNLNLQRYKILTSATAAPAGWIATSPPWKRAAPKTLLPAHDHSMRRTTTAS